MMRRGLSLLPILLGLWLSTPATPLFAQQGKEDLERLLGPMEVSDDPIDVTADKLEYNRETGWAEGRGNVIVTQGDQTLSADHMRVNTQTHVAEAKGNVVLSRGGVLWKGDALTYDFQNRTGGALGFHLQFGFYQVDADGGERVSADTYRLHNVTVTTCTNSMHQSHYRVSGRELEVQPDDYLKIRGATLRLGKVPVMYLPYWRRDLDRHYGFRFEPGYSSRMGAFLLSSYSYKLWSNSEKSLLAGRTHVDLRSERGVALGQDFSWDLGDASTGLFSVYYLNDRKPLADDDDPNKDVEETRYRIFANDRILLDPRDVIRLQLEYVSDVEVRQEFFEDEFRRARQPETFLVYSHSGDRYVAGAALRAGLNDFYDHVDRLPEFYGDTTSQQIGESGVFYQTRNNAGYLMKRWAEDPTDPSLEDYEAFRLDSFHALSYPGKYFGFLSVVPSIAYRGTYYSDTRETITSVVEGVTTVSTNEAGIVVASPAETITSTEEISAGAGFRSIFEFGLGTSFKAFRSWVGNAGPRRHIVEPYVNYLFLPEPDLTSEDLYQFDAIDDIDETHKIRLGVRNQLQAKEAGRARTTMDLDIWTDYLLTREEDQDALDEIYWDGDFWPTDWLSLYLDGQYSLSGSTLDIFDTRLALAQRRAWSMELHHRYEYELSNLSQGSITYAPNRRWQFNLFGRYEFEDSHLEEQGGYLQFGLDCLAFRVGGSYLPSYIRSDGTEREDEIRVIFQVWLTAFPPEHLNDLYRH